MMRDEDLRNLVREEIHKAKLAEEGIDECEIRIIESVKMHTPADGTRPNTIAQAVELLWRMWDDE